MGTIPFLQAQHKCSPLISLMSTIPFSQAATVTPG